MVDTEKKTCADYSINALNRMKPIEKNLYVVVIENPNGIKDPRQDTHVFVVVDDTRMMENMIGWKITKVINKTR